ncbi:MAG TPA: GvpL/GvpF family gas vesicle protein [Gemmatimonadaceae bacterium]|nr:GvpL/GvpF family gas vesicle protein [Gemmatimonadaceae bacterium]
MHDTTDAAAARGAAWYVYGALTADDAERHAATRADRRLTAHCCGDVGVLACAVDADERAAVRALALGHDEVLAELVSRVPVLPALPGTVVAGPVLDEWLVRTAPLTRELLASVAGRVEVDVTARWSLHALAREVSGAAGGAVIAVASDPQAIAAAAVDGPGPTAPRYLARRRKRAAEQHAAATRRAELCRRVVEALEAVAAVMHRSPPAAERLDVACLVREERLGELDAAIVALGDALGGVSISRGAPRAPYTFAALRLTPTGAARRRAARPEERAP